MNHYRTSEGKKVPKSIIDRNIHFAKANVILNQQLEHGYNFCQECKRSDKHPLDCAHTISINDCQNSGRAEMAWDIDNIRILCRDCHNKQDKTYIGKPK